MRAMISGAARLPLFGRLNPNCIRPSWLRACRDRLLAAFLPRDGGRRQSRPPRSLHLLVVHQDIVKPEVVFWAATAAGDPVLEKPLDAVDGIAYAIDAEHRI